MKKCLIILNKAAGNSKKISFEKIEKCLGDKFVFRRFTLPDDGEYDAARFDAVAVAGGDGTLANVLGQTFGLNVDVFYFPTGTLNDKAKAERYYHAMADCPACSDGEIGGKAVVAGFCERATAANQNFVYAKNTDNSASKVVNGGKKTYYADDRTAFGNGQEDHSATYGKNQNVNADKTLFTYTLAAGAFTPIGYTAKIAVKKRIGVLAYIIEAIKEYKPHFIPAEIIINNDKTVAGLAKKYEGKFNLIMFVKSPRCFGFNFNKGYDPEDESGHLVAIRSPKHKGALGYIEMFFPFFRVFFMGLKKEREGNIIFRKITAATLRHLESCDYCEDGEKLTLNDGEYLIRFKKSVCGFSVISKF